MISRSMRRNSWISLMIACLWLSGCGGPTAEAHPGGQAFVDEPTATFNPKGTPFQATPTSESLPNVQTTPPTQSKDNPFLPIVTSVYTGSLQLEKASVDKPPEFPADLLYLAGGKLMRWDRQNALPVSFPEQFTTGDSAGNTNGYRSRAQVMEYSADVSQRRIAILVDQGITANGVDLYDIVLLDLDTGEQLKLSEKSRGGSHINLSPDGAWLTYQTEGDGIHLYLMSTSPDVEPISLGECLPGDTGECEAAVWFPDSHKLLWTDRNGIWYYENGSEGAVNILGNKLKVTDAAGNVQELPVEYHRLAWSPKGRYATVTIQSKAFERTWVGLLDIRLKRVVEVPDTYKAGDPSRSIAWLNDGRLLAAFGEDADGSPAHLKIWKMLPAHEDILVLDDVVPMSSRSAIDETSRLPAHGIVSIDNVTSVNPRSVCMVIRFDTAGRPPTLYCLDLKYKLLERIGEVPHDLVGLAFSPDCNSIIMTGGHGSTLYASKDQEGYLDINPLLGDRPERITWLNRNVAGKPNQ